MKNVSPDDLWWDQIAEAPSAQGGIVEESADWQFNKPYLANDYSTLCDYSTLIDAGYLSFVVGVSPSEGWNQWDLRKLFLRDSLLIMDSDSSLRKEVFPGYKEKRAIKRRKDKFTAQKKARVEAFRKLLWMDDLINTTSIDGLEADDIVAYLFLKFPKAYSCVIAIDKDLYQVPNLHSLMQTHRGEFRPLTMKLPKYAHQPQEPWHFVLTQVLFGDRSDSIPRLLPSRNPMNSRVYQEIYDPTEGMESMLRGHQKYGRDFWINLEMVLIPHISLMGDQFQHPEEVLERIVSGEYWNPDHLLDLPLRALEEKLKITTSDGVWDLAKNII